MKKVAPTLLASLGLFCAMVLAAQPAQAQHRRHHHHGARVGVFIGAPLAFAPWPYYRPYYYDPYYYPRPIVIQEQPVIYTEQAPSVQTAPAPMAPPPGPQAQQPQNFWYFCQDTQTYYPHVQTCATPWQRVVPHAAPR